MIFEAMSTTFTIEVDADDFIQLIAVEDKMYNATSLCEKLEDIDGVGSVEYDGMFGSNIFLAINAEDDSEETRDTILETISSHIEWCNTIDLNSTETEA